MDSKKTTFQELGLSSQLLQAVEEMGYQYPTPIQEQAIPYILRGEDVVGSAQTGTGKTAAFALPILDMIHPGAGHQCLILEPTRELAAQVEENFDMYGKQKGARCVLLHGGVGYGTQVEKLKAGVEIIIATPGRLLDHIGRRTLSLRGVRMLVLDEVDRMLDMGFLPDVRRIIGYCSKERQTLLFSATVPKEIESFAGWVLKNPQRIEVGQKRSPAETVNHGLFPVDSRQKFDLLQKLLEKTEMNSTIIFCRTKIGADTIARWLEETGQKVGVLHADRNQKERQTTLAQFKAGVLPILVATDIVARGIDIAGVSHVVNYDVPQHPEDYVHRIGRTGRAETTGDAFTLYSAEEKEHVLAIERFIDQKLPRVKLDDFEYRFSPVLNELEPPKKKKRNRGGSAVASLVMGKKKRR